MQREPGFIRKVSSSLLTLALVTAPSVALAAPNAQEPTRKEIVIFGLLALALLGLTIVLYRLAYGFFLDRGWPVDFSMGLAIFLFFIGLVSTLLFVYLQLWPKPWSMVAWYVDLGLVGLLLVLVLVGHFRHSA